MMNEKSTIPYELTNQQSHRKEKNEKKIRCKEEDLNLLHLLLHHLDLVGEHIVLVQLFGLLQQLGGLTLSALLHRNARQAQFGHGHIIIHGQSKL